VQIEYDPKKRLENLEKHGLDFAVAVEVFAGRYVDGPGHDHPEEIHYLTVGRLRGRVVVWTLRMPARWIISMRPADAEERALLG
jgi:uncharacterized DUF497 family protein